MGEGEGGGHLNQYERGERGVSLGRRGRSCLIETNCSPLPGDTDSRPFVLAGLLLGTTERKCTHPGRGG